MRNPNFLFYKSYPDYNQSKSDKIEQILFSELKNTLEKLLEFIMSEQPLSNKKSDDENILVGIQRVHNIKEEENDDDLANNYEDFFIMNEVVINFNT